MPVNLFLPQVTRVSIAGPAPYNTLVCVATETYGGLQQVNPGDTSRWSTTVPTPFKLAGFDPRVPPQFDHSTVAFISATGPAKDSDFIYAVDSITGAGFDPVQGTYYVNLNVALEPPDPQAGTCFSLGDSAGICFYFWVIQVCSFVLVNEPTLSVQPGGIGQIRTAFGNAGRVPISLASADSLATVITQTLGIPVTVTSQAPIPAGVRKPCDCPCCRKRSDLPSS